MIDIKKGIENGITGDLLSIDLRKAIDSIGEITGQITNDEMLGNIFSNFCIGKVNIIHLILYELRLGLIAILFQCSKSFLY